MIQRTNLGMSFKLNFKSKKTETEIAEIQAVQIVIVDWIRTEIPSVSCPLAQLQSEDSFELGNLLVSQELGVVHAEVRVVVGVEMGWIVLRSIVVLDSSGGRTDAGVGHPVVIALIEVLEVNVVAVGILISGLGGVIIYN